MLGLDGGDLHKYELLRTILERHFHSGDEQLIETIRSEAEFINLQSGELLFRQAERSDDVYFLLSGRLRAYTENLGRLSILGEIGRGETVGELALFTDEPRSASVVALRNSALVKVTRRQVERAFAVSPQIALRMTRTIIERFRRSERQRSPPNTPVNVCLLPISPGIDAAALAHSIRAARGEDQTAIAITPRERRSRLLTFPVDAASVLRHHALAPQSRGQPHCHGRRACRGRRSCPASNAFPPSLDFAQ